ncbi:MAG: chemotaxis protein CheW [Deltaproteobacteria bacterium]|nr:chemotaxis protein CheW [Deltaproteobacteria bacterium]
MASIEIATFRIQDTLWGINILQVRENIRNVVPTPVPLTPRYVSGLINLRGQIVTIIDLAWHLGMVNNDSKTDDDGTPRFCIILKNDFEIMKSAVISSKEYGVVNIGKDSMGILVDKLEDVIPVETEDIIDSPAQSEKVNERLINGVVKLKDELLLLLDLTELMESFTEKQ